jgi:hypothetical protein
MAKQIPSSKGPTPEKAAEIVSDGTVNGKPLTPRQKRFMYARSSRMVKRGRSPRK